MIHAVYQLSSKITCGIVQTFCLQMWVHYLPHLTLKKKIMKSIFDLTHCAVA